MTASNRRQSKFIPDDGLVALHVGDLKDAIEQYMAYQPPGVSLGIALRELIHLGLSTMPPEAAIHLSRQRAYREVRQYTYKRIAQAFAEIQDEMASTAVLLEEE